VARAAPPAEESWQINFRLPVARVSVTTGMLWLVHNSEKLQTANFDYLGRGAAADKYYDYTVVKNQVQTAVLMEGSQRLSISTRLQKNNVKIEEICEELNAASQTVRVLHRLGWILCEYSNQRDPVCRITNECFYKTNCPI
jgi:hypothetical protein